MRITFNKKYKNIALITCMVIFFGILAVYVVFRIDKIGEGVHKILQALRPVINGLVIAYLFTPLVNFLERRIFIPIALRRNPEFKLTVKHKKRFRILSVLISMSVVYFLIVVLIRLVMPQLGVSVSKIVQQLPVYMENLQSFGARFLNDNKELLASFDTVITIISEQITEWMNSTVIPYLQDLVMNLSSALISALKSVWNMVIGIIISVYVVFNKEVFCGQAKKIVYSMFTRERANLLIKDARFISNTFINFIVGKILDSLIVGIICFICCKIFRFPYPVLVAVIIGVTNMIPVFGPFLGAIPAAFLILMVDPLKCLYFIIFILILQQVDGQIIGPTILGEATGISGFWVIFAITLFGGLWGIWGMLIGIPLFAVIYALIRRRIDRKLTGKSLPTETYEYMPLKKIDDSGYFIKLMEEEEDYYILERERKEYLKEQRKRKKKEHKIESIQDIVSQLKSEETHKKGIFDYEEPSLEISMIRREEERTEEVKE